MPDRPARDPRDDEARLRHESSDDWQLAEIDVKRARRSPDRKSPRVFKRWPWGIVLLALSVFTLYAIIWYARNIDNTPFEQLLFHMRIPLEGAGFNPLKKFGWPAAALAGFAAFCYWFYIWFLAVPRRRKIRGHVITLVVIFLIVVVIGLDTIGIFAYAKARLNESPLWASEYVDPDEVDIVFPDKKQNLIYIIMESMETTYADRSHGGAEPTNLVPHLTDFALDDDNVMFSQLGDPTRLGGARNMTGLTWTAASLIGQMGGIPLKVPTVDVNAFRTESGEFLPGATMIGDILYDEGYALEMMMGSSARFASRDDMYRSHGPWVMWDYDALARDKLIPPGHFVFWGIEDRMLFDLAKDRLTELADGSMPFVFSLLTVDTHFPDGYTYPDRPMLDLRSYGNAIAWSDRDLADFVTWCQAQPFYENTTIVMLGDHLSMGKRFFDSVPDAYDRRIYNVMMNVAREVDTTRLFNREFTVMDFFPTTLAALGATIEGDRLGYGTNLFSDVGTLLERHGVQVVDDMLATNSHFYDETFHRSPAGS